jgi:hypothetical protein
VLSLQSGWRRGARWLVLVSAAGAALAVGASASALAKAPDPSCPDGTVCLFADKDWSGHDNTYSCAPGERGTHTWDLVDEFPPRPVGDGKGVSSYISYVDRAALFDGRKLEVLKRGPRELLGSDNDGQTKLIIDCGVARGQRCITSAPGGFGFNCALTRRGQTRGVIVTFDGAKRGGATLTRTRGATKAKLCDLALSDGHPGPMVRVDTGRIGTYRVAEGRRCATYRIPSPVRKFKVWWSARSTDWVRF